MKCAPAGPAGGSSGSVSASCSVVVGDAPDLTAGSVTPTSAASGTAVTLSAPVTNRGSAATGKGFTDLFEINPDTVPATFDDIRTLRTFPSGALDAGAENTMSVSYAFPADGTYYVRACADLGLANSGTVSESDEGNNCGGWTAITIGSGGAGHCAAGDTSCVCAANPADAACPSFCTANPTDAACVTGSDFCALYPTASSCVPVGPAPTALSAFLSADPESVPYGSSSQLTYACAHAASASIAASQGKNIGAVSAAAAGGTVSVTPASSTQYDLTCTASDGTKADDYATVAVTDPALVLSALPAIIRSGSTTSVSWSGGVGSCTLSGTNGFLSHDLASPAGGVPQTISAQTTFTFSCAAGAFHPVKTVVVKIAPNFREF